MPPAPHARCPMASDLGPRRAGLRRRRAAGAQRPALPAAGGAGRAGRARGAGRRERETLVAEAGTGVGKTFAYLVPLLLSGGRALVSTATKSLQDQLFLRDLPRLRDALGVPVRMALLKGRASYLCRWRLQQAQASGAAARPLCRARAGTGSSQWAQSTRSGDLAEMDGLDERSPVIPLVTSTRDNCLGTECPEYRACHVMQARREAMAADLVVVNHHLFFADMACATAAWPSCCPRWTRRCSTKRTSWSRPACSSWAPRWPPAQAIDWRATCWPPAAACPRPAALAANCRRHRPAARELRLACAGPMREVRGLLKLRWDECAAGRRRALQALAEAALAALRPLARWPRSRRTFPSWSSARGRWPCWPGVSAEAAARPRALDRPVAAAGAAGRVAAGHPRDAHRAARGGAQGLDLHLGHAGRRRGAVAGSPADGLEDAASCAWAAPSTTPPRAVWVPRACPCPTRPATRRRWVRWPRAAPPRWAAAPSC
jgi:ATP-dependent DNA helicase DinG